MIEISGYPNKFILKNGTVLNKKTGNFYKNQLGKTGYYVISLVNNKVRRTLYIHRILAIEFIPNPLFLPCVNHKDGNKLNNSIDNLEWCTYQENNKHAYDIGLKKGTQKFKKIIDIKTNQIFNSLQNAAEFYNIKDYNLSRMINNKRKNKTNLKFL